MSDSVMPTHIDQLLEKMVEFAGSDIHIAVNSEAMVRVNGEFAKIRMPKLTDSDLHALLMPMLTEKQKQALRQNLSVDLAYSFRDGIRFRVNIFYQRGCLSSVMRRLPSLKLDLESLGLPDAVGTFGDLKDGLVLVTGPTGSGKTTTLAAIIDQINRNSSRHIITIEDPIEFVHENRTSLVTQRELHSDVGSFSDALRDSLREDPDVILVGEMRDLDTIRTAIMASETGHLVFSTLHSRDAVSTLTRAVNVFSVDEQQQIRQQLSGVLKGVVSQQLVRSADGSRRHVVVEVMVVTPAISNLIRMGKVEQIYSLIETGTRQGMQTMEHSLVELHQKGAISRETAMRMARSEKAILPRLERSGSLGR
jgi:twitching motility protein PilT